MWVPVPVEAAEARGGQRLIDWRICVNPREALRHGACVGSKFFREAWIEEAGTARAAAVVEQAGDRFNLQFADAAKRCFGPGPTMFIHPLPQHRMTQGVDAKGGEAIKIFKPVVVIASQYLIEVAIADAIDCAFNACPELRSHSGGTFRDRQGFLAAAAGSLLLEWDRNEVRRVALLAAFKQKQKFGFNM